MSDSNGTFAASSKAATARLTALWALSEAALGGALHALRLPLTGLLVGGSAVLLVTMIAWVARRQGRSLARAMLRATAVVLAVKAAASPHSPPGAYVAVAFQGAAGALLFAALPGVRAPALALGAVVLVESAMQKLFALVFFFGVPLVEATDTLGAQLFAALGVEGGGSLSLWLAISYAGAHLTAGLLVGYFAGRLPERARLALHAFQVTDESFRQPGAVAQAPEASVPTRKWRRWGRWAVFLAVIAAAYAAVGKASAGPLQGAAYVVLRALGALALWQAALRPLLGAATRWTLRRSRARYAAEIGRATRLLPQLRRLSVRTWREARAGQPRLAGRFRRFAVLLIARTLLLPEDTGTPSPHADVSEPSDPHPPSPQNPSAEAA